MAKTITRSESTNGRPKVTLGAIKSGRVQRPDRIMLVGVEGVGKSTFGASAPAPIFIAAEDGIPHLDVASFRDPAPRTWPEVLDALRALTGEHDYRTLVIDTVDWLEPMIYAHACEENGWRDIETPGWGRGYKTSLDTWRRLINALDHLRAKCGMQVVLIAHSHIRTFNNPHGPDYMRYEPKLYHGAAAILKEWSDAVLFAHYEEAVDDSGTKGKGVSTGRRVIHTVRDAAYDAKCRWPGVPPQLDLSYAAYAAARDGGKS